LRAGVVGSLLYALVRVLLDVIATSNGDQAKLQAEVLVLRRQVQVLERQIKRVRWTPGDRMVLAALRERIPRSAWASLLVKPETVLGWHRELVRRRWAAYRGRPRRGRPPISGECRQLIIRIARDNPRWGYFRIRGELLKLGHAVAATTIRAVLLRAGIPPAGRRSELTWKQFLAAHAQTLVAADFFSVDTIFFKRLYVLIYVHLATRRIVMASCTAEPNQAWVTQQARNLSWELEDDGIKLSVLIHDRDKKFAPKADVVFKSQGVRVILTPLMAPRANAHAERWIGSCRRECLDWMLVLNQRHLEAVLREYCEHYNHERPHRSRNLRPPASRGDPIEGGRGIIRRRERLGGLLNAYSRARVAA
jgi:transposase InsO family protein